MHTGNNIAISAGIGLFPFGIAFVSWQVYSCYIPWIKLIYPITEYPHFQCWYPWSTWPEFFHVTPDSNGDHLVARCYHLLLVTTTIHEYHSLSTCHMQLHWTHVWTRHIPFYCCNPLSTCFLLQCWIHLYHTLSLLWIPFSSFYHDRWHHVNIILIQLMIALCWLLYPWWLFLPRPDHSLKLAIIPILQLYLANTITTPLHQLYYWAIGRINDSCHPEAPMSLLRMYRALSKCLCEWEQPSCNSRSLSKEHLSYFIPADILMYHGWCSIVKPTWLIG